MPVSKATGGVVVEPITDSDVAVCKADGVVGAWLAYSNGKDNITLRRRCSFLEFSVTRLGYLSCHNMDIQISHQQQQDRQVITTSDNNKLQTKRSYKSSRGYVSRKEEVVEIRSKFPNKVPVIVERFYKETSLPQLDKSKFLVPQEITMSQFVTIIRNRMQICSTQAFYLLVNNRSMLSLSKTLAEVYSEHCSEDGFLYVTYASQEVFGGSAGP